MLGDENTPPNKPSSDENSDCLGRDFRVRFWVWANQILAAKEIGHTSETEMDEEAMQNTPDNRLKLG